VNGFSILRDLLGFTIKATDPEHHVKAQVLLRCRTQDPCSWVGENGQQEEGEKGKGGSLLLRVVEGCCRRLKVVEGPRSKVIEG
jgi:hypothetical protein